MSQKPDALLTRLEAIAQSLADSQAGLGLLALGSVGDERDRLDDYTEQSALRDAFSTDRRFEQRFPDVTRYLPSFMPGYEHSIAAAKNILNFLDDHFEINQAMKAEIVSLYTLGLARF